VKSYVIDTSALLRLYVPDGPIPADTEEAIELASRAEGIVFVPELALVEVAQVLHKKTRGGFLSSKESDEILASVLELPLDVVGHRDLLGSAVEKARSFALTVYDAIFLALAHERHATLLTADTQLASAWQRIGATR
jgi:predicted nucleic acid-binding protein